jgi:hypothetical protein
MDCPAKLRCWVLCSLVLLGRFVQEDCANTLTPSHIGCAHDILAHLLPPVITTDLPVRAMCMRWLETFLALFELVQQQQAQVRLCQVRSVCCLLQCRC